MTFEINPSAWSVDMSTWLCCGYLRRSREDREAELEGELKTLEKHKDILTWLAEDYNADIQRWYQEVGSGATIQDREQMTILMQDMVDGKWNAVFVKEASRLGRGSGSDQDKILNVIRHSKVFVVTPDKIYNPTSKSDMKLLRKELQDGQNELEISVDRLQDGLNRGVKKGCYYGVKPYGWEKKRVKRLWMLVPDPIEHERLLKMYDLVDEQDFSVHRLKKYMESEGWLTPHGKTIWRKATIREILYNPLNKGYVGRGKHKTVQVMDRDTFVVRKEQTIVDDYLIAKGLHYGNGTIPEDKWERVVHKIKSSAPAGTRNSMKNIYSGILRCEKCKYAMSRKPQNGKCYKGKTYVRFEHSDDSADCFCKGVPEVELTALVVDALKKIWNDAEVMLTDDGRRKERKRRENLIQALEKELESAKSARERVLHAYEIGAYTDEDFKRRREMADEKIAEVKASLEDAIDGLPTDDDLKSKIVKIGAIIDTLTDDSIDPIDKNAFLKEFIESIEYWNDGPYRKRENIIRLTIKLRD